MEAALDRELEIAKVAPRTREAIKQAVSQDLRAYGRGVRERLANPRPTFKRVAMNAAISAAGGAIAEPVRRSVVGFVTKSVRGQAAGMALAGVVVGLSGSFLGTNLLEPVADSHTTMAGWLLSVSMYGSDDAKDPVVIALEGTTKKAKEKKKKPAKDDEE
ncbi:MAG: hypothetical protein JNM40_22290 [Myxococcales bacterium]|nr:hypothetical protein [Myxococcales bacterium]